MILLSHLRSTIRTEKDTGGLPFLVRYNNNILICKYSYVKAGYYAWILIYFYVGFM